MAKTIFASITYAVLLGVTACNSRADTLTVSGAHYLGFLSPGGPASESAEVGYINSLTTLGANTGPITLSGHGYTRKDSTLPGPFEIAVESGSARTETGLDTGIDVTGFTYLLGKYGSGKPNSGGGDYVWYVKGLTGMYSIPSALPNAITGGKAPGLSHYTLFNPAASVPDGGVTFVLLGGVLFSLEILRRRFGA